MIRFIFLILLTSLTISCTLMTPTHLSDNKNSDNTSTYEQKPLVKNVNHYTKWLIQDLFSNIDAPNNSNIFAVVNFALLDSDLKTTNHFGRQLQESIMHETNRTGFSVIDLKSSGRLQLTTAGDIFWHSEKTDELTGEINIDYVITGTMTKHQGGYLLNARIIDVETSALISTSQILVPATVVKAVLTEENTKGFPIISNVN